MSFLQKIELDKTLAYHLQYVSKATVSLRDHRAPRVSIKSTLPDQSLTVNEKNRQHFKPEPHQLHVVVRFSERLNVGTSTAPPPRL